MSSSKKFKKFLEKKMKSGGSFIYIPFCNIDDIDNQDDFYIESGCLEEEETDEMYPPLDRGIVAPIVREISGSKKNLQISCLAEDMLAAYSLKAVGERLYSYDNEKGCFSLITKPDNFIEGALSFMVRDKLSTKDISEIAAKLLRNPYIQADFDDFNAVPTLVNCQNGVVDISGETIQLHPHSPKEPFNYVINASYYTSNEEIYAPVFDQFCKTSLDDDITKRRLLLQMMGYIYSDSIAGKCALFMKGAPDSGKSVIGEFISRTFDDSAVSNIMLNLLSNQFNKAELFGKKLNFAGEIKASKMSDITIFKMITGGDRIAAEYKGKDPFYFRPRCKLLFSGNALPSSTETDSTRAFANRLVVLLFNKSIPLHEQDKELLGKIYNERSSIFTLAMQEFYMFHHNNYQFDLPQESIDYVNSFFRFQNSFISFIEDRCILSPNSRVFNKRLLEAYSSYCKKNALEEYGKGKFYAMLDAVPGIQQQRFRVGNENCHGRTGIELRSDISGTLEQI